MKETHKQMEKHPILMVLTIDVIKALYYPKCSWIKFSLHQNANGMLHRKRKTLKFMWVQKSLG
jgi:hypothetical protein